MIIPEFRFKVELNGEEKFDNNVENSIFLMIELSKEMLKNSVRAFNDQDQELADLVLKTDDKIDKIYRDLFSIIESESFTKEQVKKITNTLSIAKSFERLADHSTNIAEITKFVATGEIK